MNKKNWIVVLLFVVLAGAIAGAFVFLNQMNSITPPVLPGATGSTGSADYQQGLLHDGAIPVYNVSCAIAAPLTC